MPSNFVPSAATLREEVLKWIPKALFSLEFNVYFMEDTCQPFVTVYSANELPGVHVDGAMEGRARDPTYGFVSLPVNISDFHVLKPYDLPDGARYSYNNGIHKLWVLSSDKTHSPKSLTLPRTEIGQEIYHYKSGVWQFEGNTNIPSGTTGVCIIQIFAASHRSSTSLMLRVYNGALMYYRRQVLADDIYGKWIRVNVIHDLRTREIKVFLDGELKMTANDNGADSHTFKFGVYSQSYSSYFMESLWKGVKVFKLPG